MLTSTSPLVGKRVLVVEDEYMIADDLACELRLATEAMWTDGVVRKRIPRKE